MKKLLMANIFSRLWRRLALAVLLIGSLLVYSLPARAIISGGSVTAVSAANLVAGTVDADYTVAFSTDITATANTIVVTFPNSYAITDGSLGQTAVSYDGTPGIIFAGGGPRTVTAVIGNNTSKTISVTISTLQDLSVSGPNTFTILTGITNPTTAGAVAGNFSINTNAAGETAQTNIATETITGAAASYLKVTGSASVAVGANNELTVTAKDQYGNTATSYTGDKTLTFSGPSAGPNATTPKIEGTAVGSSQTVSFSNGVTNGTNLTFVGYAIQNTTIDVTDGSLSSAGDATYDLDLNVTVGAAASLSVDAFPTAVVSGIAWDTQPTVTAYDAGGNVATGYGETVTISKVSGAGTMSANSMAADSGVAAFSGVKYTNAADGESFTVKATDSTLNSADSSSISSDILATKLVFTTQPSANATSGSAFAQQPVVKAEDADNLVDTDFTGLVTLTPSTAGTLSGDYHVAADSGVATFPGVAYTNAAVDHETFTLTADEAGSLTTATSNPVDPNVVANALSVNVQPGAIVSGVSMTQPVIHYVFGSIIDTDVDGDVITATEGGDGTTVDATEAAVDGVADFSLLNDLIYTAVADGEAVTFTFTDDAIGNVNLSGSPVNSAALTADVVATKLVWDTTPATCNSGLACTTQGVLKAQDALNTLDSGYSGAVTIAIGTGSGSLVGSASQGAMTAGSLTTDGIGYLAASDKENFTFTADSGTLTQAVTANISADIVATKLVFTTQPSATATSGSAFAQQPQVSALNAANQVDTDFTAEVTLSDSAAGNLSGDVDVAAASGVAVFTDVAYTNSAVDHETFTLSADEGGSLANATSDSVNPNVVANALAVGTQPAAIVSHVSMTQPVVNYVRGSIIDTDVNGDVITATENGNGAIAGGETATAINGVATFSNLVYNALADGEAVTFTFTDDAAQLDLLAAPVNSDALTANVVASKLLVTLNTNTPNAGTADTLTLTAANTANITDAGYNPAGLTFTLRDSEAALLSTHTSPNASAPTIPNSATIISAFSGGVANLATFTLVKAEVLGTITVSDGTLSGTSAAVTVRNIAASSFQVSPESLSAVTGTAYDITTTALDAYGNVVNGANGGAAAYTGQVFFSTNGAGATWHTPWVTFVSGDAGVKTAANAITFNTAENNVTITAANVGATVNGTSADITVTASATTPTVAITAPLSSATISGAAYSATFTTNGGATTAAFVSIDGGAYVAATTNANPGTYTLDTTALANGSHTMRVKDTVAGLTGYSDYITFTVANNDTTAPTGLAITTADATVNSDYYTISGTLTADSNNVTVQVLNGADVVGTVVVTAGQTAWSVAVPLTQSAVNTLTARATDPSGNAVLSTANGDVALQSVVITESTTAGQGNGTLAVTSITPVRTYATAGGGFAAGWSWTFNVTVPTTETSVAMKFTDWVSGSNTIPAATNIRFYSAQSADAATADSAISLAAANTYSTAMTLNADLDAATAGRQIQITVEARVPDGQAGGSYSTSYGVQSE